MGIVLKLKLKKSLSKPAAVISGIPQSPGYIVWPIIFVNDLPGAISQDTSISLYADDAKMYKDSVAFNYILLQIHICKRTNVKEQKNTFLKRDRQLQINLSKCKVLLSIKLLHWGKNNKKGR